MKVHELIAMLNERPRNATVYVLATDPETSQPILNAVETVAPIQSDVFGSAVVIEMEN